MALGCLNRRWVFYKLLLLSMLLISFSCRERVNGNESGMQFIKNEDINERNFKQVSDGFSFILTFKNVWIDGERFKGKLIKVPIYKGISGDVKLSQLKKVQKQQRVSILGSLVYRTNKGELKNTIIDCVRFYKDSFFRNIDYRKPTIIGGEESGLIIWYDFDYEGFPSSLMIGTSRDTKCKKCLYRYIDEIEVDEEYDGFDLKIRIGTKSPFFDQRTEIKKQWEEYSRKAKK